LDDSVAGPMVAPGTYSVVLDYNGQKMQENFTVALDPRLHATQADLEARLELDLQIYHDLDALDKLINQALNARDKLQKSGSEARALAALNQDIDGVAQMAMKSSEGSLLFETKLRDHLAYLAADIDLSYGRPTASQEAVFRELDKRANEGAQKLEADLAEAGKVIPGGQQSE